MSANWLGEFHSTKTDVHFYVTVVIIIIFFFFVFVVVVVFFPLLSCVYLFDFIAVKLLLLLLS